MEYISIYCENEDVPLSEVLVKIAENNQFKEISVPEKGDLFSAITSYVPIDQERVYESDVKKLFTWYNLLVKNGILTSTESTKETADEAENPKEKEEENKDIKAKA